MRRWAIAVLLFSATLLLAQDTEPPEVINMDPVNGATGVASDATISLDIVDDSEIDMTSISIIIMGFDVSRFILPSEIPGGIRYSYSPPVDLPDGLNTIYITACDEFGNCLTSFEYSFTVSGGAEYFAIQGRVTLSGSDDYTDITVEEVDGDVSVTADTSGMYVLLMDGVGEYEVYAHKHGWLDSDPVIVELTTGVPIATDIDFTLEPDTTLCMLSGYIILSGATDHSGTKIRANDSDSTYTDPVGYYELRYLTPGTYILYMTPPTREWNARVDTIEVIGDTTYSVELTVPPPLPPRNIEASDGRFRHISVTWDASESTDVTEYQVYRALPPYTDMHDAEYLGSTSPDTLFFYDRDLDDIYPEERVLYSVVAVGEGGPSELGIPDSGYYATVSDTSANALVVDLITYWTSPGWNETEWWQTMLEEHGITVIRTDPGEALELYPLEDFDAVIICCGNSGGDRIDLTEEEFYDLQNYVEDGGNVYLEGSVAAQHAYDSGPPYSTDFEEFWGYEQNFAEYPGHPSEDGNVLWCESTDFFFESTYIRMSYEPFSMADLYNSQLRAGEGASVILQSQPDGEMGVPVEWSRGRAVYKDHAVGGATVFSSVYLGVFYDGTGPYTRANLVRGILIAFGFVIEDVEEKITLPEQAMLLSASPNPFNASVSVNIENAAGPIHLTFRDATGRTVHTADAEHIYTWNAENMPSGIYLCTAESNNAKGETRLFLVK